MISVQECIVAGGFEHSGHFQLCIEMPHNMAGAINNMADMQLLCSTYIALCQLEAEISRVPRCRSGPRHRHSELVRQVKFFHAGRPTGHHSHRGRQQGFGQRRLNIMHCFRQEMMRVFESQA